MYSIKSRIGMTTIVISAYLVVFFATFQFFTDRYEQYGVFAPVVGLVIGFLVMILVAKKLWPFQMLVESIGDLPTDINALINWKQVAFTLVYFPMIGMVSVFVSVVLFFYTEVPNPLILVIALVCFIAGSLTYNPVRKYV